MHEVHKLDNPVWYSLSEVHAEFCIDLGSLRAYHARYCPFAGHKPGSDIQIALDDYAETCSKFFVVGEKPVVSANLQLNKELVCLQMVMPGIPDSSFTEEIVPLNSDHSNELFDLVNLVQPGYFMSDTVLMGDYYGIFKGDRLVAAAGERMKMNLFTEVSAIVTHPEHIGRGLASQLTSFVSRKIIREGKIPYLHVAQSNARAIRLYQKLGFETRRHISFWNYIKAR